MSYTLGNLFFKDSQTGWLCGSSDSNRIYRTTDRGVTWRAVYTDTLHDSRGLFDLTGVRGSDTLWCIRLNFFHMSSVLKSLLRSTDGGTHWASILDDGNISSPHFATGSTGLMLNAHVPPGEGLFHLLRTTDGGFLWNEEYRWPIWPYSNFSASSTPGGEEWAIAGPTLLHRNAATRTWEPVGLGLPPSSVTSAVTASPDTLPGDGLSRCTIVVTLKDITGGGVHRIGGPVRLHATLGSLGAVLDLNDGTYRATLTAPRRNGIALISGALAGQPLFDTAVVYFVRPPAPSGIMLGQNYPNPFNSTTVIPYGLPYGVHVTLRIYNVVGQELTDLVNADVNAGYHEIRFNASNLASGVYFYRLHAGSYTETRKLILMK